MCPHRALDYQFTKLKYVQSSVPTMPVIYFKCEKAKNERSTIVYRKLAALITKLNRNCVCFFFSFHKIVHAEHSINEWFNIFDFFLFSGFSWSGTIFSISFYFGLFSFCFRLLMHTENQNVMKAKERCTEKKYAVVRIRSIN